MSSESDYDTIIAPMLLEVAKRCEQLGMKMCARVEWEPGESGVTTSPDAQWSGGMTLATLACHAHGNVDRLCMALLKKPGADQSIFLARFLRDTK